jgi:UDP-N-acetylmuramoyl-tripeptide--D-alanyl-D-alanine ligase
LSAPAPLSSAVVGERAPIGHNVQRMATPIPDNECPFTLGEAAHAVRGKLHGDAAISARGVSIDTRTLKPGALFVALRGAAGDGHAHLDEAAVRGAAGAIVEMNRGHRELPYIEVADTLDALGALAHHHLERTRAAHATPVLAIGGAVGKTTTKELAAAAVRALFGATLATPGNLNNRIGVPMTLLTLTERHRAAVIECATNMRGEISKLARIVEPDAAMVLNVDLEHSEGLGSLEEIADEEAALFSTARRVAITSSEEALVLDRTSARLRRITFGMAEAADVRVLRRSMSPSGNAHVTLRVAAPLVEASGGATVELELRMLGAAAALNAAAALAGAAALANRPLTAADLRALAAALANVEPVEQRLVPLTVGGIFLIDDSYNSSPRAVRVALAAAREAADARGARLVVALGDMLELGAMSTSAHRDAVRETLAAKAAALVAVGPEMSAAAEAVCGSPLPPHVRIATDSRAAALQVRSLLRAGDVLLAKGSRGIAMEHLIEALFGAKSSAA